MERFFIWIGGGQSVRPRDVLFYSPRSPRLTAAAPGSASEAFHSDLALGEVILEMAQRPAASQLIYSAPQASVAGIRYDVFARVFYTNAARTKYFAVVGYLVNFEEVRARLLPALLDTELGGLLNPADGMPAFEMRILDERGQLVFGPSVAASQPSAEAGLALQFCPEDDIRTRMAAEIPRVRGRSLSASGLGACHERSDEVATYWVSALSVLHLRGPGLCAAGSRRAAQLAQMQADFVARVSHQLKTPVSLLSAVGETLDLVRARSPEKLEQCLDIIKVETARLSTLVQHMLEFSSVSDGDRRFELEAVSYSGTSR